MLSEVLNGDWYHGGNSHPVGAGVFVERDPKLLVPREAERGEETV